MLTINKFRNCKSPNVSKDVTIEEFFNMILTGDTINTEIIQEIRTLGKQSDTYKRIKESQLPTFRFNFLFKIKANNHNVIKPTGLIYIDVDDSIDIDLSNNLIYATWRSLSNTGRGILVKVDGLTLSNFSDTYISVGKELGLDVDAGAAKATQQTVLSYDPNLFINNNSITFKAIQKKVTNVSIPEKEKELLETFVTFFKQSDKLRFNNINEYFIDGNEDTEFIIFDGEKEKVCIPFIPTTIPNGKRNLIMFYLLSQYALLNQTYGYEFLLACAKEINKRFEEKYDDTKINSIITSVLKKRDEGTLLPLFNKERRLLFNPKSKLDKKQKQNIVNKELGKIRRSKTENEINDVLLDWDFEINGKITQKKISEISGKSTRTIKRNWIIFEEYVKELNIDYGKKKN